MIGDNIQKKLEGTPFEKNKSLLARETKLNRGEIINILTGKTKNPGVRTIGKIARVLKCSVSDLLDDQDNPSKDTLLCKQTTFQKKLFSNIVKYVLKYIDQHKLHKVSTDKVLLAIDTIYSFSHQKRLSHPEEDAAKVFCRMSLK